MDESVVYKNCKICEETLDPETGTLTVFFRYESKEIINGEGEQDPTKGI